MSTTLQLTRNVPPQARHLLQLASREGWFSHGSWGLDRDGLPLYRVSVTRLPDEGLTYVHAVIVWHTGARSLHASNRVFRLEPGGPWTDLPSLRHLMYMIENVGSTKE